MKHISQIVLVWLFFSPAYAASFDCAKAETNIEKLICATPALSELDSRLDQEYRRSRADAGPVDVQQIVTEQKDWLRNIRNKCTDQSCLNTAYIGRVQALGMPVSGSEPLALIAEFSNFRTDDYPIIPDNGRLFFSQFDKSGNNFEVISFDMANLNSEVVIGGIYGGKYIAQNDKYLVINEKAQLTNPLVVFDKKSGKQLGKIKLQQMVSWGRIDGNRLIAIQGGGLNRGYQLSVQALILELPSLKIVKSVEIVGGNDVQFWQGKILSLGRELAAYDLALEKQFEISLPERRSAVNNASCAATWPLAVYENKAVIVANCGEILIYDLPSRKLEHIIPAYSHFYAITILDGLIFSTPTSEPRQKDNTHVHDLFSGKELAILPINATDLFTKGNRLLAVEHEFAKQSHMKLYKVNSSTIRKGQWRNEQVISQCKKAQAHFTSTKDLYGAIDLCKTAGIEGFVENISIPDDVLPWLQQYGVWLSLTFDKGPDAIKILEKIKSIKPERSLDIRLAEVRLRTRAIEGANLGKLSSEEQQTNFARMLGYGNQVVNAKTKNIPSGSFAQLIQFSGDRIFIANGETLCALDRTSLNELGCSSHFVGNTDPDSSITSLAVDATRVYLTVESNEQAVVVILDKKTLQVVSTANLDSVGKLIFDAGNLMSCGCHFTEDQQCALIDLAAKKSESLSGKYCIQNERGSEVVVSFNNAAGTSPKFVAVTKDYLVARAQGSRNAPYSIYPRAGGESIALSQQGFNDAVEWPISVDGNAILIGEATRGGRRIKLVSLPSGDVKTLFGLPTTPSRFPVGILHKDNLYVGFGRDLLVYNLGEGRLKRYIKDFISAGYKDNGHGLDMNRIDRLFIDQGRLIALTFYGENSRIIQLADL